MSQSGGKCAKCENCGKSCQTAKKFCRICSKGKWCMIVTLLRLLLVQQQQQPKETALYTDVFFWI